MKIRDRIQELRRVPASTLRPHPLNWRTHPRGQRELLESVLEEVGYADALLARELSDGTLELIDGHLRAETTPDAEVPVLIVDLTDEEAAKLLALHDPITSLAETDEAKWKTLNQQFETDQHSIAEFLRKQTAEMANSNRLLSSTTFPESVEIVPTYQVIVQCGDESQQKHVYEQLSEEGFQCRVLTL